MSAMINWGLAEVEAMNIDRYPEVQLDAQGVDATIDQESRSIRQRVAQALVQFGVRIDPNAAQVVDDLR